MGITDGMIIFCNVLSEESVDKKNSTIEYNIITVYDFFDNPFPDGCGGPSLNIPPIIIDNITPSH